MKQKILPDVYSVTLEFLQDRVQIYNMFLNAADTEEARQRYGNYKGDYEEVLRFFTESYAPGRRGGKKPAAQKI